MSGQTTGATATQTSVRDQVLDELRGRGLTTLFSNPGSTEVPLLSGLPDDFRFVLALHEASVVGMATGWALARGEPGLVLLHTTAGLGNAVGAIATARANRAPLAVLVGQQDRRHLASEPFLAGHLDGLAGDYPIWHGQPARPQDLASTIARACHEATTHRGPALVIVPMDGWAAPADDPRERAAPNTVLRTAAADATVAGQLAELIAEASTPALVVGAGADDPDTWTALVRLVEGLGCAVWQEPFGARAGFPQDHPNFAGHLPFNARGVRETLAVNDLVVVLGAAAFRQYPYESGRLLGPDTRVVVVTEDPDEAHRSIADIAVVGPLPQICQAVAERVPARTDAGAVGRGPTAALAAPQPGSPMLAGHVFDALRAHLPADAVVIEESPSSRRELHDRLPARAPLGFLSAAMGGLGFALPAAVGVRMALPGRAVVAVVGDGSSLYSPQALWSAAHYGVGALFIVLQNGGYAIMDRLAEEHGEPGPWPSLTIDVANLARSFGCEAMRVDDYGDLVQALADVAPTLPTRTTPLLLEVAVAP